MVTTGMNKAETHWEAWVERSWMSSEGFHEQDPRPLQWKRVHRMASMLCNIPKEIQETPAETLLSLSFRTVTRVQYEHSNCKVQFRDAKNIIYPMKQPT